MSIPFVQDLSDTLYQAAQKVIPGGVNSPVRAFKNVGGQPIFFKKGRGAYLTDVDNNQYIDYVCSWGALILGHCHPKIIDILYKTALNGTSFGAPTLLEIQLAEKIIECMPAIEQLRMVNSGTEATMTAIRLARGYTKKNKIIKFNGCYHGHNDALLAQSGSGLLTLEIQSIPGVPNSVIEHTIVIEFNDLLTTEQMFKQYSDDIAAIIVEPIAGNMALVLPNADFLKGLRDLCDKYSAVLIFDEVMTGFRVALGGAQSLYNIVPDLTTLGKVIGGGLPIGALGGKTAIMSCLAPNGLVYQAGTLSGNPLAMAVGLATLKELQGLGFYENLSEQSARLINGLAAICDDLKIKFHGSAVGGMFGFSFVSTEVFNKFFHGMLKNGVYFAPSAFESGFISNQHSCIEIDKTLAIAATVLKLQSGC